MRIMTVMGALGLLAMILTAVVASAKEGEIWSEASSPHFILRTNAIPDVARKMLEDLEKFRSTVGLISNLAMDTDTSPPLVIYAYEKVRQYTRRMDMKGTAGFYVVTQAGPVSVLSLEDGEEIWQIKGREVLYHEYTHHILNQYSSIRYPRWYDEGLAEFLSTMRFENDIAILGHPPIHRFIALKQAGHWLTMRELLESKERYIGNLGSSSRRNPDRGKSGTAFQYAQGWLTTHFLHNSAQFQDGISPYLVAIDQPGANLKTAFKDAFGVSYEEMDDAVREYWYSYKLPYSTISLVDRVPQVDIHVREMHAMEASAVDLEARFATGMIEGDEDEAVEAFTNLLEAGIRPEQMRRHLTHLAMAEESWETAHKYIDATLTHTPNDPVALTLKARILAAEVGKEEIDATRAREIKEYCLRAIKADPSYVPALISYAEVSVLDNQTVDDTSLKIIESIRFLAPGLMAGKILAVKVLARTGRVEDARLLITSFLELPTSRTEERRFKKLLKEIENLADADAN